MPRPWYASHGSCSYPPTLAYRKVGCSAGTKKPRSTSLARNRLAMTPRVVPSRPAATASAKCRWGSSGAIFSPASAALFIAL